MAENSIYRLFRYYYRKLKTFLIPKNVLSFLLFLALSTAFWYTNALDKTRENEIRIPIEYKGIPKNILISSHIPPYISVIIRDQGINLLSYSNVEDIPLIIDVSQSFSSSSGDIIIGKDQLKTRLSRYLLSSTSVISLKPDFISLKYDKLSSARKKVRLVSSVKAAPQYIIGEGIQFSPKEVTVYGPKRILDTLRYIYSDKLQIADLKDTLITKCRLQHPKNVKLSHDAIKVSIFTEMFTEKELNLPITIVNCPPNVSVRCFPAMVETTFNIAMSHFAKMKTDDIQLIFDYNQIDKMKNAKLKLSVKNNTKYISNIRILPEEVEYILE